MTNEEVVSVVKPAESSSSLLVFLILSLIDVILIGMSLVGILGLAPENWEWDQFTVGMIMTFAFLVFTLILLIYWKQFMPFVLVKKTRREKKEIPDDYYKEINHD